MKMNKILAAGIAATMAVTSLSAVVSAEEKSFPMAQTVGVSEVKDILGYYFTDNNDTIKGSDVNGFTLRVTALDDSKWDTITAVKMEVTGLRNGSTSTTTEKYDFANGALTFRNDYVNEAGQANLDSFDKITGVKIYVSVKQENIFTAAEYDALNGTWGNGQKDNNYGDKIFDINVDGGTAGLNAGSLAFVNAIKNSHPAEAWYNADRSSADYYHFLAKTTDDVTIDRFHVDPLSITGAYFSNGATGGDHNQTGDPQGYGSNPYGFAGLAGQVARFFNKQTNGTITFKFSPAAGNGNTSWNNGGIPSTETGLLGDSMKSTAFALFFNYQTTTGSLVSLGEVDADALTVTFDIADVLDALNGNTIGTIQDIYYGMNKGVAYSGDTVVLVPEIITVGNAQITVGTKLSKIKDYYQTSEGYLVESVTLAYDEDAADDTDIEEDDDDDDAPVVDDDDDTTDDVADDDDDATIDEDDDDDDYVDEDDDDDTDVDGDVDEPVTPADDDDDANPGTGVALAVVPALVAAAAVVVSKKRK